MNININPFYCYIKKEHLFDYQSNFGEFEYCLAFAVRSMSSRALLFHVMLENGAQRANVPISAIVHKKDAVDLRIDLLQLWDCFGSEINVIEFDYLCNKRCQVVLKDKTTAWGSYMMTFDWENNPYSNTPQDYKNAHLIKLDNGCFALQPNNRILWRDSNFINNPLDPKNLPKYKVDKQIFVCENADKWSTENTDCFYYDVINNTNDSVVHSQGEPSWDNTQKGRIRPPPRKK
jgi:hypothetical protein